MMALSPIDQNVYDESATAITYYKIFKHIVKDFITREDAKEMMKSTNLPVQQVLMSQVQVAIPAGTGTGVGNVNTQVKPIYNGSVESPGTQSLAAEIKTKKKAAGAAVGGLTDAIGKAMG